MDEIDELAYMILNGGNTTPEKIEGGDKEEDIELLDNE